MCDSLLSSIFSNIYACWAAARHIKEGGGCYEDSLFFSNSSSGGPAFIAG